MALSNPQTRYLKGQAHHLKPVVIIGGNGLTDSVLNEIDIALESHELIKVRINAETREDRKAMIDHIVQECGADHVQTIGHIGIFYRAREKNPTIVLP